MGGARPASPLLSPAAAETALDYSGKGECTLQGVERRRQEVVGDNRLRGPIKPPSFNLINCHINCLNCSPPSVVLKKKIAMPRPATPALACIGMDSSHVPTSTAVPTSALCVDKPHQHLGPAPATTALAPAALPTSTAVAIRTLISPAYEAAAVP